LSIAALPCCTKEDVEAGSADPACRLAKPIHAAFEHITVDEDWKRMRPSVAPERNRRALQEARDPPSAREAEVWEP
jgi:hypothetical protein